MKKPIQLPGAVWSLSIYAAIAVWFAGCATPERRSFNQEFNDHLPVNPQFYIHDQDANHFLITVEQGSPSTGAERVVDVKQAATTVAKAECRKLGWDKWDLNYLQERDQGWMHIVIADVTRQ
jgi:hypothetical protein